MIEIHYKTYKEWYLDLVKRSIVYHIKDEQEIPNIKEIENIKSVAQDWLRKHFVITHIEDEDLNLL